jgi:hypothetical protein
MRLFDEGTAFYEPIEFYEPGLAGEKLGPIASS